MDISKKGKYILLIQLKKTQTKPVKKLRTKKYWKQIFLGLK